MTSAYNPFKQKNIEIFCLRNTTQSAHSFTDKLSTSLQSKSAQTIICADVSRSILEYHNKYSLKSEQKNPFENLNPLDFFFIVSYQQQQVYGLSGNKRFSGYVGGNNGVGVNSFGGIPITINLTDENPEWQYQATASVDIYDTKTGKRILTLIKANESSSDDSDDIQTISENIDNLAEEITDLLFKRKTYWTYSDICKDNNSTRDTEEIQDQLTEKLLDLFTTDKVNREPDILTLNFHINENGFIDIISDSLSEKKNTSIYNIIKKLHFGRIVKPDDQPTFQYILKTDTIFGGKLTNGFYCQIEGERNKYEVWNILYKFINEFVKHEYIYFEAEDPDKEAAYIQFEIDNAGRTQNIIIAEKTKYVKPIEKKIIKTISEWNFGDKDKKDSGKTTIDVIFTFNKQKIVCNQITD